MDGLALLCNLFADGPVTLQRLRVAHVESLADLERVPGERLASWLHASVPQARSFADEAKKLARRLSEPEVDAEAHVATREPAAVLRPAAPAARAPSAARLAGETPAGAVLLRPGLLPGLDAALVERLQRHRVRTVQALAEFAGLELARRTGIPYSKLLELARRARRFVTPPLAVEHERAPVLAGRTRPERSLPREEPRSSGPFV